MDKSKQQSKKDSQNDNIEQKEETYEELKTKIHNELDEQKTIRGEMIYGEVLEYVKLMQHDYERRQKEYWDMFYKSIFCTGILLIVPYFI
jgi:predicted ribosome quality control (RQC) complex YloA/Tae2 family protein